MRPSFLPPLHAAIRSLSLLALTAGIASAVHASDVELTETVQLPECHSLGWVRANTQPKEQKTWDGVLDEAKWGTPSPQQAVSRNWDWRLTDEEWRQAVAAKGEGKKEDVKFDLWIPAGVKTAKGIVVMSGHGSGENLFKHPELRKLATELNLALFKFVGNPMQRGFWPRSLLYDRLKEFGQKSGHPELANAPLFLYGHSNGTGFSAIFTATESSRVWAWVSMRPGTTFQVYQPERLKCLACDLWRRRSLPRPPFQGGKPDRGGSHAQETRRLWTSTVEPKTGHGPGGKTWPLVFSFLRHTFAARVPTDSDPGKGPIKLTVPAVESGNLGKNWDPATGGYQTLKTAPFQTYSGEKATASWLVNEAFAKDWQSFQREGKVAGGS
ncbi:hypothetical protein [Verrucomicrobium spinosum]|uniref:hypothetical protein n=1 Tax=Verrucomicrobium spinosum TaxID=2736 RepID=UPI00094668F6|nr:hypothetical protein [Verrucomicrobium spinosum]